MSRAEELAALFKSLGIDCSYPGFYDDPRFVQAEKRDPSFLEAYAEYVRARPYASDYLARAESIINRAAEYLYGEIRTDGRLGACIDASGVLCRFLEKQEVWSYQLSGALTIRFDDVDLQPRHYWPYMAPDNPAKTGHSWLSAPPFALIDLTLSRQENQEAVRHLLPEYILERDPEEGELDMVDLYEPEVVDVWLRQYGLPPTVDHTVISLVRRFGIPQFRRGHVTLKYTPIGVSAPDIPLGAMRNLVLSGKPPQRLYEEFLRVL